MARPGLTDDVLALISHPELLAQVESAGSYQCEFGNRSVELYRPTDESDILTVTVWNASNCIVCWDVLSLATLGRN